MNQDELDEIADRAFVRWLRESLSSSEAARITWELAREREERDRHRRNMKCLGLTFMIVAAIFALLLLFGWIR